MKFLFQFARLAAFCLAGELLYTLLPLPVPASIYGLALLLAALVTGLVRLEQVRETALFLTGIFPVREISGQNGRTYPMNLVGLETKQGRAKNYITKPLPRGFAQGGSRHRKIIKKRRNLCSSALLAALVRLERTTP